MNDRHLSASATILASADGTMPRRAKNGGAATPKMGLVRRTMSFQFGRKKTDKIEPNTMAFIRVRYKDVSKAVIWPEYAGQPMRKAGPSLSSASDKSTVQYHSSGNHQPAVPLRLSGHDIPKDIRKSVLKANTTRAAHRKPIDAISMSEEGLHTGSSVFYYAHAYDITNAAEMEAHGATMVSKAQKSRSRAVSTASSTSIDPQPQPYVPPRSVDDYTTGPNPIYQADIEDERSPYMPAMINSVRRSESESSSDSVVHITRL
ncbi:hypothetical protein QR680_019244 [Steinernema hermaphroditum]|uniref:Uncharacterized protein n=1 Tax=Steinernema hermaphroditum TaxID=289476 RepID=A0AA39HMN1_9BILA|nr:hypothetical protein QR680_019244 [Steinernema hermaphroditum]